MIKARTKKKNIFAILGAVLSAVFAVIIGATFCASTINLKYGTNPNTTTVYAANNHYHINNDTNINPIPFGAGSHNFEISIEYDVQYDFDARFAYTLKWSNNAAVDNVILHLANRDEIIMDKNYLYLVPSITDKTGKRNIITGVSFTDPEDSAYLGATLTITITEKVVETQTYSETHPLLVAGSQASDMWLLAKTKPTATSKAMVTNYRYNWDHGMSFPGVETAYFKTIENNAVTGTTWLGGNRGYAGVGIYVYAGAKTTLTVSVKGVWRTRLGDTSGTAISESGILFNYSTSFGNGVWDSNKVWQTVTFNYSIPATKSCYINVLDSMEIISTAIGETVPDKDAYRAVIREIAVNGISLHYAEGTTTVKETGAAEGAPAIATYTETNAGPSIQTIELNTATSSAAEYSTSAVEMVNTSLYADGLYQYQLGGTSAHSFITNISLINTTSSLQTATVSMNVKYRLSNGKTDLLVGGNRATSFDQDAFFTYVSTDADNEAIASVKVTIAPYSSVSVLDFFTASAGLQANIDQANYDVWVFVQASVVTSTAEANPNVQIETTSSGDVYLKNNSTKVATIMANQTITLRVRQISVNSAATTTKPNDWEATYWMYYTDSSGTTQNTSIEFKTNTNYYKQNITYSSSSITIATGTALKPGECKYVGKISKTAAQSMSAIGQISATLSDLSTLTVINEGTSEALLVNASTTSVYVRIKGTLSASNSNERIIQPTGDSYIYYIGILRPGQKFQIKMASGDGTIETIAVGGEYVAGANGTVKAWGTDVVAAFDSLFNTNKSQTT